MHILVWLRYISWLIAYIISAVFTMCVYISNIRYLGFIILLPHNKLELGSAFFIIKLKSIFCAYNLILCVCV